MQHNGALQHDIRKVLDEYNVEYASSTGIVLVYDGNPADKTAVTPLV